jgi:endonuclease-3
MNKKEIALLFLNELKKIYPEGECALKWEGDPFKLFVMAVLSAQCTDERVNLVSEELFKVLPTPKAFAESEIGVLEKLIHSVGLYNSKSKNLRESSKIICSRYNGEIPSEMEDLLSLPGVGRKVANLLRGDIYNLGGIVADTHCIRVASRLGLTEKNTPLETEKVLSNLIPVVEQSNFCHRVVLFGREVCSARKPSCNICPMIQCCKYYAENGKVK